MRRFLLLPVLLSVAVAAAVAQPKVAVLNAVAAERIDQSVTGPVTEKVIERLVASGSYLVLDRANVQAVLKEREFQYSGLVSDAEISEAGKYLGADRVVVIRIESLDGTYFLSARMIDVETGIISRQASADGEGKLSVLLGLAERVGSALASGADPSSRAKELATGAGGARTAPAESGGTAAAPRVPEPAPAQAPSPAPPPATSPAPKKTTMADRIGVRLYYGYADDGVQELSGAEATAAFHDFYLLVPTGGLFCLVTNFTSADGTDDGGLEILSFDMGVGLALPLGFIMPWCAAKVGFATLAEEDWSGFQFTTDLGIDFRLGALLLGVRRQVQSATFENSAGASFDLESGATLFMVGLKF
jgi:hypothetical protein